MANKIGGLGRGLDALFAQNTLEDGVSTVTLPLDEIIPNKEQPRKQFDEAALADLSDSIAQHGVLQPLLVQVTYLIYTLIYYLNYKKSNKPQHQKLLRFLLDL